MFETASHPFVCSPFRALTAFPWFLSSQRSYLPSLAILNPVLNSSFPTLVSDLGGQDFELPCKEEPYTTLSLTPFGSNLFFWYCSF